ncbi:MAG: hypothetical protein M3370_01950 [Actinomycetota bacterium]|nr:hypothetical protein [Actinomycetota bacterium]
MIEGGTITRAWCAALVAVAAALALPAAASGELAHKEVKVDQRNRIVTVGGYHPDLRAPNPDPSIGAALGRFGEPSRTRVPDPTTCEIGWSQHGLTIFFANFGGGDPCVLGRAQVIVLRGQAARGWHTNRGLYIRGRQSIMRREYRVLEHGSGLFSLQRTRARFGTQTFHDVLTARITDGRVNSLGLFPLAAGD